MNLDLSFQSKLPEAGCDEAGRGCLAGPVFAAAVILPSFPVISGLNDSKKLSATKRDELALRIKEQAVAWAIAQCSAREIDEINILWASVKAMHRAIDKLPIKPGFIAVDGNRFKPYREIPHKTVIKGDGRYMNIAAASILAKTARDEHMLHLHNEFPEYGWNKNMGYPTATHRDALHKHGATPHHRMSFRLLPVQIQLL